MSIVRTGMEIQIFACKRKPFHLNTILYIYYIQVPSIKYDTFIYVPTDNDTRGFRVLVPFIELINAVLSVIKI